MNLYLLVEWYKRKVNHLCYFIDLFSTVSSSPPVDEDIERFWSHHLHREPERLLPKKPVVFIVLRSNHYFTVCFDYVEGSAWVFGKSINVQKEIHLKGPLSCGWFGWDGSKYWTKVTRMFRWSPVPVPTLVNTINFPQVESTTLHSEQNKHSLKAINYI